MIKKDAGDIIIAVAINFGAQDTSLNQVLIPELVHIGMSGSVPIIPSIIQAESLLELNALAPQYCESWSRSVDEISHDTFIIEEVTEVSDIVKKLQLENTKTIDLNKNDLTTEDLITAFRSSLKAHGAHGIFGIARKFKIIDDDNSGQIDIQEFTKCISEHAHDWNAKQIKMLFDFFDKDKSGSISYNEFLLGVREKMNDRRTQLVFQAFEVCIIIIIVKIIYVNISLYYYYYYYYYAGICITITLYGYYKTIFSYF